MAKLSHKYPSGATVVTVLILMAFMIIMLLSIVFLNKKWQAIMKARLQKAIEKRRNFKDSFRKINGYSWDYVMVFKVYGESDRLTQDQVLYSTKKILNQLTAGGLEVRLFYSFEHKEIYCKIRASMGRLKKEADRVNMVLPLDSRELRSYCEAGTEYWAPLNLPDKSPMTSLHPYDFIYAKYYIDPETNDTKPYLANLYKKWKTKVYTSITEEEAKQHWERSNSVSGRSQGVKDLNFEEKGKKSVQMQTSPMWQSQAINKKKELSSNSNKRNDSTSSDAPKANSQLLQAVDNLDDIVEERESIFRGVDRLKLIYSIVNCNSYGGCYLDTVKLQQTNCILAFFPLHDEVALKSLEEKWLTIMQWPWTQDEREIKDYFGEKIGLYFVFLGQYTTWLIPVAFFGFLCFINVAVELNNPNAVTVPYFAGLMALWSSMFLEFWKRSERTYAMQWGMTNFEENEAERPSFIGMLKRSPITGKKYKYFPRLEQIRRSYKSYITILAFIIVVISIIALIFFIRIVMDKSKSKAGGQASGDVVSSLLIAIQIQVLNSIYAKLAFKLNEYENHRTDTDFENSLISKTFLFQFVNSYVSLIYIAFIKPFLQDVDPCLGQSCMGELQTTLGTIFITRLTLGNITEVFIPLIQWTQTFNERDATRKKSSKNGEADPLVQQDLSEVERAFTKPSYDPLMGTFDDYAELVIQFGYTTMFICSFPLATTMAFISNYVEMRIDSWKLCRIMRRPDPRSAEDIGSWYAILEIIAAAAVFTNAGLIAFTGKFVVNYSWVERSWIFISFSFGLFFIRLVVNYYIPDVPQEVELQLQRQEFLLSKVIDNKEDDNDEFKTDFCLPPKYAVEQTDYDPL